MSADEPDLEAVYNEMFAYRYTDKDPDYVETISKPVPPGPCVANYFNRPKRNYDQNRGDRDRGGRGRWRGGYQGDRGGQGQNYNQGEGQGYRMNRESYGYDRNRSGGRDYREHRDRHNRYQPY